MVGADPHGLGRDWSGAEPAGYPEPAWEVCDPRFDAAIGNAPLLRLWTGAAWTEGPVWLGDWNCLLFSDIPSNRVLRWCADDNRVSVFDPASNNANGQTRDREGRVVRCEHASRAVARIEHDGARRVLVDRFENKRLNAPNDVIVAADGAVWFTDPTYGIQTDYEGGRAEPELPTRLYRLDPGTGRIRVMLEEAVQPNGLCLSPDGATLYLADSGTAADGAGAPHILAFDVAAGGAGGASLEGRRVFARFPSGVPDGMRCDRAGRLWSSCCFGAPAQHGVHAFDPDGTLLATLHLPEGASNLEFGGAKRNRLFVTAGRSLYAVAVNTAGARSW